MSDPTLRELDAVVQDLGDDERRVLVLVARRLLDGQRHYGRLDVAKVIAIVAEAPHEMVQTAEYSYNVSASDLGNVFRYDSPHADDGGGHHDDHHRHAYEVLGADPSRRSVTTIPQLDDVPTLGQVIEEAREWYFGNLPAIEAKRK